VAVVERCAPRRRPAAADWAALSPGSTLTLRWRHPVDAALVGRRPRARR
jgi:hypothetical protein